MPAKQAIDMLRVTAALVVLVLAVVLAVACIKENQGQNRICTLNIWGNPINTPWFFSMGAFLVGHPCFWFVGRNSR